MTAKPLNEQILEHTAKRQADLEVQLVSSVAMKAFDIIALEAIRLGMDNWYEMKLGDLRKEIKRLQDIEKKKPVAHAENCRVHRMDGNCTCGAEDKE